MKLYGILGKGTGKLGSSVFAISGGEQIMREYNPVVSNPNTEAQIAQRAKLKLMSQLAADLSAAIAFQKQGLVSARNQFVAANIGLATFANNEASVDLDALKLTPSSSAIPNLTFEQSGSSSFSIGFNEGLPADVKKVAIFIYRPDSEGRLTLVTSALVDKPEGDVPFSYETDLLQSNDVVYAYGVKDNGAGSIISYEDYVTESGSDSATLDVISYFQRSGYKLTKSVGKIKS